MQDIWSGWATLDTANVSRFYDKNANDTFFDVEPLKYKGWSEYESGVKNVFAQWQTMKATVNDDAQVHANGNLYWGTATVHLDITPKQGNPMSLDVRWTALWQKQGNQWLIVHEHVSAPLK
jgi:ketosteroid isomerase-like protein